KRGEGAEAQGRLKLAPTGGDPRGRPLRVTAGRSQLVVPPGSPEMGCTVSKKRCAPPTDSHSSSKNQSVHKGNATRKGRPVSSKSLSKHRKSLFRPMNSSFEFAGCAILARPRKCARGKTNGRKGGVTAGEWNRKIPCQTPCQQGIGNPRSASPLRSLRGGRGGAEEVHNPALI